MVGAKRKPPDTISVGLRTLQGCEKIRAEISLAPLQGANRSGLLTGGLSFAATSGYYLTTLRVATVNPPRVELTSRR